MKAISIRTFLIFLLIPLFITEFSFANSRMEIFQGSVAYKLSNYINHIVRKNDSVTQIAQQCNWDPKKLALINGLDNPDLIYPGKILKVKCRKDGSIIASFLEKANQKPKRGTLPFNYTPKHIVAHVTLPNKEDVFAPENPSVSYEVKEAVLEPVRKTLKEPLIFKTFEKFVRWLSSSLGYSSDMIQTNGQASFDPPTSPTYLHSNNLHVDATGGNGIELAAFLDNYSSHITSATSPPPKSL
jgi:LysM repeat protein